MPVQPSAPVNWEPVIDKDGTYHFGIGHTEYTGKLLTDFTGGTRKTGPTFGNIGKYEFAGNTLKAYTNGQFVDMYDNFSGGGLKSGNYSTARYVGVRVKITTPRRTRGSTSREAFIREAFIRKAFISAKPARI